MIIKKNAFEEKRWLSLKSFTLYILRQISTKWRKRKRNTTLVKIPKTKNSSETVCKTILKLVSLRTVAVLFSESRREAVTSKSFAVF